jgi:hypothetical protein
MAAQSRLRLERLLINLFTRSIFISFNKSGRSYLTVTAVTVRQELPARVSYYRRKDSLGDR